MIESDTTNASGTFTLETDDITAGDLTISFTLSGYVTARGSFTITSGTNTIDQILLAPESSESGTITGTLIEEAARVSAADAQPMTDINGSEEYKRELVHVLVTRSIKKAATCASTP